MSFLSNFFGQFRRNRDLWEEEFYGKPNNPEVLQKKAKLLSLVTLYFAEHDTRTLINQLKKLDIKIADDNETFIKLLCEVIYLYIHMNERMIFAHLGELHRAEFCNNIRTETFAILSEDYGIGSEVLLSELLIRDDKYSGLPNREYFGGGETVFRQFGEIVSGILNANDPLSIGMVACIIGMNSLIALDTASLIYGRKYSVDKKSVIETQFASWHEACMIFLANDQQLLNEPRSKLGACLFFIGSIDYLCQHYHINDVDFAKITDSLLQKVGFPSWLIITVIANFYLKNNKSKFALEANLSV